MLKYALRKYAFLPIAALAFLLFSTYVWDPQPLIVPPTHAGFVENLECTIPYFLLVFFSFLLPNHYEIELSLVCGCKTTKLVRSKAIPILQYTLLCTIFVILCYRYTPFADPNAKVRIPIYVPDNFRIYILISAVITVLYFSAVFLFIRVASRNCYIPIGVGLFIYTLLYGQNNGIRDGTTDLRRSLIDPFITNYFVGDTVPNLYAQQFQDMGIMRNMWTHNRLLFLGVALGFFLATHLLLRREKLHESLGN